MDFLFRMEAPLIDMGEQNVTKTIRNGFKLFRLQPFFGIARENLVAGHAV